MDFRATLKKGKGRTSTTLHVDNPSSDNTFYIKSKQTQKAKVFNNPYRFIPQE